MSETLSSLDPGGVLPVRELSAKTIDRINREEKTKESRDEALKSRLAERFHVYESTVIADQTPRDGTRKLLLR